MPFLQATLRDSDFQRRFDLADAEVLIGRGQGAQVRIGHRSLSRHHCKLVRRDASWYVVDLGSTNGTLLNDRRISGEQRLLQGDLISIGVARIAYFEHGVAAASTGATTYPSLQAPDAAQDAVEHKDHNIDTATHFPNPIATADCLFIDTDAEIDLDQVDSEELTMDLDPDQLFLDEEDDEEDHTAAAQRDR